MRCAAADRELMERVRCAGEVSCRVVGVYRKAVNLLDQEERLVTVVLQGTEPVPGGLLVAHRGESPWPPDQRTLRLCWEGSEVPGVLPLEQSTMAVDFTLSKSELGVSPRRLEGVRDFLAEHCPPGGIASLLKQEGWENFSCPAPAAEGVLTNFLRRLAHGSLTPCTPILGLGIGLTPSSDDFVLGLMAVFHRYGNPLGKPVEACVRQQLSGTTPVSGEMLRNGLDRQYPLYIHRLLAELERGGSPSPGVLEEFLNHGHSSGTDMLYGILWGLELSAAGEGLCLEPVGGGW